MTDFVSSSPIYAGLYFAAQFARGGVTPRMIASAGRLLDGQASAISKHIALRLHATHGAPLGGELSWLDQQPTCDRSTLIEPMRALIQTPPPAVDFRKTSGSTGTPFAFVKSREMTAWMDAVMWAVYAWHGIQPGQAHARFWGTAPSLRRRLSQRGRDLLLHRRRLGAFDLGPARTRQFFKQLRRLRPKYAYGYPSVIAAFADQCAVAGLNGAAVGFDRIVCTGELLPPATRDKLETYFGCRVVNEYGCTESGILAFECESGALHLTPVAAYAQVVDGRGAESAEHSPGEVICTDLFGRVAPLLRYRMHDRATRVNGHCACGRSLPQIELSTGRIDSFIRTPTGVIYDAILAYHVPPSVTRFRVTQIELTRLDAAIVVAPTADPQAVASECRRRWERALGPGMSVSVRVVDYIPSEDSGKLRYFVPMPG